MLLEIRFFDLPHSLRNPAHWLQMLSHRQKAVWGTTLCLGRRHHLDPGTEHSSHSLWGKHVHFISYFSSACFLLGFFTAHWVQHGKCLIHVKRRTQQYSGCAQQSVAADMDCIRNRWIVSHILLICLVPNLDHILVSLKELKWHMCLVFVSSLVANLPLPHSISRPFMHTHDTMHIVKVPGLNLKSSWGHYQ